MQSWARDNGLASQQRQRNNRLEVQGQEKIKIKVKGSVSEWSSHIECVVIINKQQHGHVAVL